MTLFSTLALGIMSANAAPPKGIVAIDHIQPVKLTTPFTYEWNAVRPITDQVTILVVEVSPGTATLRQSASPVLYVGATPAARVHPGQVDHHLVVFVPGTPDLSKTPVFWGPDTLPERVTAKAGTQAVAESGAAPFSAATTETVTKPPLQLADQGQLYGHMASLIDTYAPADERFSESIRVTLQQ